MLLVPLRHRQQCALQMREISSSPQIHVPKAIPRAEEREMEGSEERSAFSTRPQGAGEVQRPTDFLSTQSDPKALNTATRAPRTSKLLLLLKPLPSAHALGKAKAVHFLNLAQAALRPPSELSPTTSSPCAKITRMPKSGSAPGRMAGPLATASS
jgi:hypothetical protein